jgi:hypothetical protein
VARTASVRGAIVRIRHPWGVFVLTIVTLGIYYLYWYYATNRELRDYGIPVRPSLSLLAITVGGLLLVPPFVSEWRYFVRIGRAQERAGLQERINHAVGFGLFLLALIFLPFEAVYAQHHLNRVWQLELEEEEKRRLGMRGQPART